MKLGLIINTCNQADYLGRVLRAVSLQSRPPEEVLIADDGSTDGTSEKVKSWSSANEVRVKHLWQKNEGFRRARILNLAIAAAESDYLVFLDGDSVPHPGFVDDHTRLAAHRVSIQGHRALIQQSAARSFGLGEFARDRVRALASLQLRGIKHAFRWPVPLKQRRSDLRGVRGCNLGIWREDLLRVNGYNEKFVGWGREDSELLVRLMNSGVTRLNVRGWALCYHLWHPPAPRSALCNNDEILRTAVENHSTWCDAGLSRHLASAA